MTSSQKKLVFVSDYLSWHRAVIRRSSSSHLAVIGQSSRSHQAVIWQSSGSHQAVIKQSSSSHQAVINYISQQCHNSRYQFSVRLFQISVRMRKQKINLKKIICSIMVFDRISLVSNSVPSKPKQHLCCCSWELTPCGSLVISSWGHIWSRLMVAWKQV